MSREKTSPSGPSARVPRWSVSTVVVSTVIVGCVLLASPTVIKLEWAPRRPLTPAEHVTLAEAIRLLCDAPITFRCSRN